MADPKILVEDGEVQVSAILIARELGLPAADIVGLIKSGALTSLCEQGAAEDAGRYRLTFFVGARRLRFVVDRSGGILEQEVDVVRRRSHERKVRRRERSRSS